MKISVICKSSEWQVEELRRAADEAGAAFEVRDLDTPEAPEDLGEVVIWRSSSLVPSERRLAMRAIMERRFLINRCLALHPQAAEKAFQQARMRELAPSVDGIETFVFGTRDELLAALAAQTLRFPFIQKPNKGSKGENISLIKEETDLKTLSDPSGFVYQNFVENQGDYRVLMLGGKMLGAMRRMAKPGDFLNNVSKGGSVAAVTDPAVLKSLHHVASSVASIFDLSLCGVDVIYDEREQKYRFLEVNTVPQWKGFQQATGINVADAVVKHCQELESRVRKTPHETVLANYRENMALLHDKRFHFLSRMALWTGDDFYREALSTLQPSYLGSSEEELRKKLARMLESPSQPGEKALAKERRARFYEKYPLLQPYLDLLFRFLFSEALFGRDIRLIVREHVPDAAFRDLETQLLADREALRTLSTHAVNYLYLVRHYLSLPSRDVAVALSEAVRIPEAGSPEDLELALYLITHCIIGASGFYSRAIPASDYSLYRRMLSRADEVIGARPKDVSLDIKCEFLVCARMLELAPRSRPAILEEVAGSLAPDGNFLVDRYNWKCAPDARNSFAGGEHRNVLFLMALLDSPLYPLQSDTHA